MEALPSDKRVILRFLKDQFPGHADLAWPDLRPGTNCEIDATFTMSGSAVALEHTRIARFPEEAASRQQFKEIRDALGDLSSLRPLGLLTIFLPCRNLGGKAARREILERLSAALPALATKPPGGLGTDIPLSETIKAWAYVDGRHPGDVVLKQFHPESRVQFCDVAEQIPEKISKLFAYKRRGFRTMLLLETMHEDSYPHPITDALIAAERREGAALDELWEVWPNGHPEMRYSSYELDSFRKHFYGGKQ